MNKAEIWDLCIQNNIFEGMQNNMVPKIQEIFETTINENTNTPIKELLEKISINIKSINTLNYKDLLPKEKKVNIQFNDDVQDEPLQDLDKILEEKQKERNLFSLDNKNFVISPMETRPNPLQNIMTSPNHLKETNHEANRETNHDIKKNNEFETNIYKMLENQNNILVKILQSQIKILEYLQKNKK